jgi:hypothetical protein
MTGMGVGQLYRMSGTEKVDPSTYADGSRIVAVDRGWHSVHAIRMMPTVGGL